jgi:lambda repressor-like predicted transcriptional regulator
MLNLLLTKEMMKQGHTYASLSRKANLNAGTLTKALEGDGRLSVYTKRADALGVKIKYTVE